MDRGIARTCPVERRWNVILHVPGGLEEQGHGDDTVDARRDRLLDGRNDRGIGQLEETGQNASRFPAHTAGRSHGIRKGVQFLRTARVTGAVSDQ